MTKYNSTNSEKLKKLVLILLQRGLTYKDLANKFDIMPDVIKKWVEEYRHPYLNTDIEELNQLGLETVRLRNLLWETRSQITTYEQAIYYKMVRSFLDIEHISNKEIEQLCSNKIEKLRLESQSKVYRRPAKKFNKRI